MQTDEQLPALSVQIPTTMWPTASYQNHTSAAVTAPAAVAAVAMQKATSSSSSNNSSTATPRPALGQRSLSHRLVASKLAAAASASTQPDASASTTTDDDDDDEEYGTAVTASTSSSPSSSCSSSTSEPMRRFLAIKRRHSRSASAPEQPQDASSSSSLHVDTFLPLQLPPRRLCASSPLLAYPASWRARFDEKASTTPPQQHVGPPLDDKHALSSSVTTTETLDDASIGASLRRTDSLASFISASSDGSWHGDQGDEDPDGQLARALHEMNKREKKSSRAVRSSRADSSAHKVDDGALRDYINDEYVHGHGPLHVSTHDYEDEEDFAQQTGAYETEKLQVQPEPASLRRLPDTPTVIRTLGDYQLELLSAIDEHHHTARSFEDDDDELAILQHAGPIMARMAAMLFNLDEAITADDDITDALKTSPFERRISRSFSDPSSPAQLGAELSFRRRRYSRRRAATVATERDVMAHEDYHRSGSKRGHLAALWKWLLPDVDTYLPPGVTQHDNSDDDGDDWLARHMKWSTSVPSLVSPDDDDDDDLATPVDSDDDYSPNQHPHCYGESIRRKSGFGLSSFESSAFEDGDDHVGRQRSTSSSSSILLRSLSHPNLAATVTDVRPHPSPLWDDKLTEEPYSRSWSSMFGLTAMSQ